MRTLSSLTAFMLVLTIARVSSSSLTILAMSDFLMCGLTNIMPFGETDDE